MVPITLLVIGAWLFIPAFLHRRRAAAVASWARTEGTILSSAVETSLRSSGTTCNSVTYHRPAIGYAYEAGGERFTAKRLVFGEDASTDPGWAQGIVDAAPPSSPVTVFYDLARRGQATLRLDPPSKRLKLVGGGILIALGVLLVVAMLS